MASFTYKSYNFLNPSHPDLRIAYMRAAIPYILQNMDEAYSLDQSLFNKLAEIANETNLCEFLPMLAIASRNRDFSKLSEKLHKIDNHVQGNLPEIFTSFIEVKAKHSANFEITDDMLALLQRILEPLKTASSFEELFGSVPQNIRKSDSRKNRCYSCWKSDFKIVLSLLDLTSQKEDLTIEEIRYLGLQLRSDYVKDEDLMKQTIILLILHQVTYSGQILHDEALKNLEKRLLDTTDLQTKKRIVLILTFALRNKQVLNSETKKEMEIILDYGRVSAANTIKYFLERSETKDPSKITLKFLKTIHGNTQNQLLKESLLLAIRVHIAKFPTTNKKFEELDDKELLNDPKLSQLYEDAALRKQILSSVACENLAIIISSNDTKYSIDDKRTSSSALRNASENAEQTFPMDVLEHMACSQTNDTNIINNICVFIGNYSQRNISIIGVHSGVLDTLKKHLLLPDASINASFAFEKISENMENQNVLIEKFSKIIPKITQELNAITMYNIELETLQNLTLAFGYAAKSGSSFDPDTILGLTTILNEFPFKEIGSQILSCIGLSIKKQGISALGLKTETIISRIANSLESEIEAIRDSARATLEIYITISNSYFTSSQIEVICKATKSDQSAFNAVALLHLLIKSDSSISFSQKSLIALCESMQYLDTKIWEDVSEILLARSKVDDFEDAILDNFRILLCYENPQVVLNLTSAIRFAILKGSKPNLKLLEQLKYLCSSNEINDFVKQNAAISIGYSLKNHKFVSEFFKDPTTLNLLENSIGNGNPEVDKGIMLAIGSYFEWKEDANTAQDVLILEKQLIKKIEMNFNHPSVIGAGLFALNKAAGKGHQLSYDTITVCAGSLMNSNTEEGFKLEEIRVYAMEILQTAEEKLTDKEKVIYEIEKRSLKLSEGLQELGCRFLRNSALVNILSLIEEIKLLSKHSYGLTQFTFKMFDELLSHKEIAPAVISALASSIKNSMVPDFLGDSLVITLKRDFVKQKNEKADIIKALLNISARSSSFPKDLIECLEEKIFERPDYFSKDQECFESWLSILHLAAIRGNRLNLITRFALEAAKSNFLSNPQVTQRIRYIIRQVWGQHMSSAVDNSYEILPKFETGEKDLDELLKEMGEHNPSFDAHSLRMKILKVEECYENPVQVLSGLKYDLNYKDTKIRNLRQYDIKKWAEFMKEHLHQNPLNIYNAIYEIVAIIKRALLLCTKKDKHELRRSQLISIFTLFDPAKSHSRIAQISTGEGKSTIISAVAVIKALLGIKIDIITSSSVLAKRDAEEKSNFYSYFKLKVSHNCDEGAITKGTKKCYQNCIDIVYGDIANFQFDLLRDEFSGLGTRGDRKFNNSFAIIDEADNLLLDGMNNFAMLSNILPSAASLYILFTTIWTGLTGILKFFIKDKKDEHFYEYRRVSDDIQTNELERVPLEQYEDFLTNELIRYSYGILEDATKDKSSCKIPKHLLTYVKNKIEKFARSAVEAKLRFKVNCHYLINKDEFGISRVVPIDLYNTGTIQNNTTWGDGLQQFIQIKEGLYLTPDNLITNFISNSAYILRYGDSFCGLTGTLGSQRTQKLLRHIYNLDFVVVPRYKFSHFTKEKAVILQSEEAWFNKIKEKISEAATKKRATLIICETCKVADELQKRISEIKKNNFGSKISRIVAYTRDDNFERKAVESVLDCGDVIIATILGGRGTDIKTTEDVEEAGGLYVCVTFLPTNKRVQAQAFGRTARQGNKGSAQIILNTSTLDPEYKDLLDVKLLRQKREKIESRKFDLYESVQFNQDQLKEKTFSKFCALKKTIRDKLQISRDDGSELPKEILEIFYESRTDAIEEQWGFLYQQLDFANENATFDRFSEFESQINLGLSKDSVIESPVYHITCGNNLINYGSSYLKRLKNFSLLTIAYELALKEYNKAIELSNGTNCIAFYKRAFTNICLRTNDYKNLALQDLKKALDLSDHSLTQILALRAVPINNKHDNQRHSKHEYTQQIANKISVIEEFRKSVNGAIKEIEESQKLIDVILENNTYPGLQKIEALRKISQTSSRILVRFHSLNNNGDNNEPLMTINTFFKRVKTYQIEEVSVECEFKNIDSKELACDLLPAYKRHDNSQEQAKTEAEKEEQIKRYKAMGFVQKRVTDLKNCKEKIVDAASKGLTKTTNFASETYEDTMNFLKRLPDAKKLTLNLNLLNVTLDNLENLQAYLVQGQKYCIIYNKNKIHGETSNLFSLMKCIKENFFQSDHHGNQEAEVDRDILVTAKFFGLTQPQAKKILENAEMQACDIIYPVYDLQHAQSIIWATEDKYLSHLTLLFKDLDAPTAKFLVKNAKRNIQDVRIPEIKTIHQIFANGNFPLSEIREAEADGLDAIFQISENNPIRRRSCLIAGSLGAIQVLAGSLLIAVPGVGTALISEGIGDIITALKGAYFRNFSWGEYAAQKALSLVLSLASAGFSRLSKVSKAEITGVLAGAIDDQVATTTVKTVQKTFTRSAKDQFKLATKVIVTHLAETGSKELIKSGINSLVSDTLNSSYETQIKERIHASLSVLHNNQKFNACIAYDKFLKREKNQKRIKKAIENNINSKHNRLRNVLKLGRRAINPNNHSPMTELVLNALIAAEMTDAINKISNITNDVKENIERYIDQISLEQKNIALRGISLSKPKQEELTKWLEMKNGKDYDVLTEFQTISEEEARTIYDNIENYNLLRNQNHSLHVERDCIVRFACDKMSQFVLELCKTSIIQPLTDALVDKIVNGVSEKVQKELNDGITVNQEVAGYQAFINSDRESITYNVSELQQINQPERTSGFGNIVGFFILFQVLSSKQLLNKSMEMLEIVGEQICKIFVKLWKILKYIFGLYYLCWLL